MSVNKNPKEKIEELDLEIKRIKEVNQKAQSRRDQLNGAKQQLELRKEELMKKIKEEFGATTLDELKSMVKNKISELDRQVKEISSKIQIKDDSLEDQF